MKSLYGPEVIRGWLNYAPPKMECILRFCSETPGFYIFLSKSGQGKYPFSYPSSHDAGLVEFYCNNWRMKWFWLHTLIFLSPLLENDSAQANDALILGLSCLLLLKWIICSIVNQTIPRIETTASNRFLRIRSVRPSLLEAGVSHSKFILILFL